MKTQLGLLKILFLSIMFTFAACSSDDNNGGNDQNGGETPGGVTGGDHTYDIELVDDSETIQISGTIPNPPEGDLFSAVSLYVNNPEEEGLMLNLTLSNNDTLEGIFGIFVLNDDRQSIFPISHPEDNDNPTTLRVRTAESDLMYHAISGTLNFSNVKLFQSSPGSGLASFTLDFEGVFMDPLDEDNTYQGSGTIVYNPIEGLSYD